LKTVRDTKSLTDTKSALHHGFVETLVDAQPPEPHTPFEIPSKVFDARPVPSAVNVELWLAGHMPLPHCSKEVKLAYPIAQTHVNEPWVFVHTVLLPQV
jgi:hypothetical protein